MKPMMAVISSSARNFLRIGIGNNSAGTEVADVLDNANAAQSVTPDDSEGTGNSIVAGVSRVDVGAVTNDANDFIVLPSLADVPVGHTITIACNAGTNFEMRTPAASGELINTVDSDGTNEYLCTDTETVRIWKQSDADGWIAQGITALGAVATAVVPDNI